MTSGESVLVVGDILTHNVRNFGPKTAIVDSRTGKRYSWESLNERVNRLANGMRRLGVRKGDRAAFISDNSAQCAEFYFAVAKIGAVGCALNYRLQPVQLERHIADAEPRVAFYQSKYSQLLHEANPFAGLGLLRIDQDGASSDYEALLNDGSAMEPDVRVTPDDALMITYTSGTTGIPKGVVATHRNRIASAIDIGLLTEKLTCQDVLLNSTPFCIGVSGQTLISAAAMAGATVVMDVLSPSGWADTIARERVTALVTTKARLIPIRSYLTAAHRVPDFTSIRRVSLGGQAHSIEEIRGILQFFGITACAKYYGMAETSVGGTRLLDADVARGLAPEATDAEKRRLLSVGKPLERTQIRIVDGDGGDLGPEQAGEILVKGDCVSPRYWKDPARTAESFKDGWFHTHDLGVLDRDGYLYLRGRKDYMINTGGLQVAPIEVEQVIQDHPAVLQVAVIGTPDQRWGEAVTAVVCLHSGTSLIGMESALKAYCRQRLAGYQVPKRWRMVHSMPMDEQGRINVKEVRALFGEQAGLECSVQG